MDVPSVYRGVPMRYGCDANKLSPALRQVFVGLHVDSSTEHWIDHALERPHGRAAMLALAMARKVMSDYDANGLVGAHDMRVLGEAQWAQLFAAVGFERRGNALDVGAGEGQVTDELRPFFDDVVTTELSMQMARRLRKRGYRCHEVDLAEQSLPEDERGPFDFIALLNVIDRTRLPYRLVERLRDLLADGGLMAVAVPFPLSPHVHVGAVTIAPEEILPKVKGGFEAQADALAENFFGALDLEVVALSRVPYLCRGNAKSPVMTLDDAIFLVRRRMRGIISSA